MGFENNKSAIRTLMLLANIEDFYNQQRTCVAEQTPFSHGIRSFLLLIVLFTLNLLKVKKKNVSRKSIEKTSNLDIFCGNHFKDLHLRPTPNNVLSLLTAKKKLHPIEREST